MASKGKLITSSDNFVKVNNGGIVSSTDFVLQIQRGEAYIGSTAKGSDVDPDEKDCFNINDIYFYSGADDVYIKTAKSYISLYIVVDEV